MKDWTGNSRASIVCTGGHNYSAYEREQRDYYATEPKAAELLLQIENLNNIWECAAGEWHLADVFQKVGLLGKATDTIDRNGKTQTLDFLTTTDKWNGDIVTNPPFRYALEFTQKALSLIPDGRKVAMFLRIQWLEGKTRRKFFDAFPPKTIYISSSRLACAMNGNFKAHSGTATSYAWYVWQKGYKADTILKWFN